MPALLRVALAAVTLLGSLAMRDERAEGAAAPEQIALGVYVNQI